MTTECEYVTLVLSKKCKQSKPISQFKLRSAAQGRAPSWCRQCSTESERLRYHKKRRRAINEHLRRIRFNTPAAKVQSEVLAACKVAGGADRLGQHLKSMMKHKDLEIQYRAARILLHAATASVPT